jgi:hypothetical protein
MTETSSAGAPESAFGLRWSIKRSFVDYVLRMPDGQRWVGDGAVPLGTHEVVYPPRQAGWRPTADGGTERIWSFRGDVRFSGHAGLLAVRLAAPVLTMVDGAAELTVANPSGADDAERLPLATLRLEPQPAPDGVELWSGTDVALTGAGAALFNGVYPPGEPLEPMTLMLPVLDGDG